MDEREFFKEFAESKDRERLVNIVYDEIVEYCYDNDIPEDEISPEDISELAEGFVKRGFTFD